MRGSGKKMLASNSDSGCVTSACATHPRIHWFRRPSALSVRDSVAQSFAGDLAVTPPGFGGGLDPKLAERISALPGVQTAVGVGTGSAEIGGDDVTVSIADFGALSQVTDIHARGGLAVSRKAAREHGWKVGSPVRVRFLDGSKKPV